jgi:type IV secretory pathway VirJ component
VSRSFRTSFVSAVAAFWIGALGSHPALATEGLRTQVFAYGRFGEVTVYRPPSPRHLVLFLSGDGGWNLGVKGMARSLTDLDATVVGIDIRKYEKAIASAQDPCTEAAADFTALARAVEEKLGLLHSTRPILVGYSSGATLAYALLVQAEPHTFGGALVLGFCPDLDLEKPLCPGHGLTFTPLPKGKGYLFDAAGTLEDPFIVFQGDLDQVCDPQKTAAYTRKVRQGELVWLPKVGHGFSVERRWLPQFKEAFLRLAGTAK